MQVVGYETTPGEGPPALVLAAGGEVEREPLTAGRELAYSLGGRHCAGALTEGGHEPCDQRSAPYCADHTDRWPCARCRGDCDRPLEGCREEHAVYLAAFAPATFKVGVTKRWRLETRLREQGADRAAHVRTVADGRIARQLEADWAKTIPDRVRVPEKIAGLHRSVDEAAWEGLLADFEVQERFDFAYDLALDARPVAETLATGTVVGTTGRILVLAGSGATYAVDMRDLLGHELEEGATDRELQSSLGSF